MLIWIAKYWKPLALLALIVAAGVAWRIDRAGQYRAGEVAATAKLNAAITEEHKKQVAEVLEKERQATAALAAEQAKIERERQYAKTTIAGMRGELGRLQQYAENQRRRTNLPKAATTTGTLNDEALARGWALFGKCAIEYAGVAEVADEQRNDLAEWQAYGRVVEGTNVEKP